MPVISLYRHGMTGGVSPKVNSHTRAIRGDIGGWSSSATRRNTQFLYSVKEKELGGVGYAVTLTLRHCPASASDWHKLRRAWENRMRRAGMVRMHWVTEWQRRGVPHLHAAVWFPDDLVKLWGHQRITEKMRGDWVLMASEHYGAGYAGQHSHLLTGAVGWFQYVSKHAARGVKHYQRSSENIPDGWRKKTGRMWGKVGDWPVQEKVRFNMQDQNGDGGWFAYRRLVRSWRVADARAAGDPRRLRLARSMLRCTDAPLSRVRGVSEWVPESVTLAMFANLGSRGYSITC